MESHPSKLVGSRGSKNRFFDFDKLAEVCVFVTKLISMSASCYKCLFFLPPLQNVNC
jgi:hypothetical protein